MDKGGDADAGRAVKFAYPDLPNLRRTDAGMAQARRARPRLALPHMPLPGQEPRPVQLGPSRGSRGRRTISIPRPDTLGDRVDVSRRIRRSLSDPSGHGSIAGAVPLPSLPSRDTWRLRPVRLVWARDRLISRTTDRRALADRKIPLPGDFQF